MRIRARYAKPKVGPVTGEKDADSAVASSEAPKHVVDDSARMRERPSRSSEVPHFTPAERAARGRAARSELPGRCTRAGSRHRSVETRSASSSSRRRPGCRSSSRSATGACSSRRSPSSAAARYVMAADLADRPDRAARAALRRRAPLELRHLRGAGAQARLRHQRLRRDAARPVRVGREAARGELRGRRPRRGFDDGDGARSSRRRCARTARR